ncbi:MAG: imidazole glycerol phosphate synthase subunit HisH [Phycisphaerales bacterium]
MSNVTVVRTGTANLASVLAALHRCGATVEVTQSPDDVRDAEGLVLPGVGTFGAVMDSLVSHGLIEPLRERFASGRQTLAICLGLQILAQTSCESPGVCGLGLVPTSVERFSADVRVPQLGWNRVEPASAASLIEPGYAYYANSYRIVDASPDWLPSYSHHGGKFVAALERRGVLACQFHPELSGAWGQRLLMRWLSSTRNEVTSC